MANVNDDTREGYGTSAGEIGRNCAQLVPGTHTSGNSNDLEHGSNTLSGSDEVKNIIDIT